MSKTNTSNILSNLFGRKGKKNFPEMEDKKEGSRDEEHPLLAFGTGLSRTRGYIKSYVKRVQHALQESGGMERILRPTPRIGEDSKVREKEEERIRRASEVSIVVKKKGFEEYVSLMRNIEGDAYYNLRNPGLLKKENISLDYTVGFYAGALSVIDDFFQLEQNANKVIKKENDRIEELRKKNTETE